MWDSTVRFGITLSVICRTKKREPELVNRTAGVSAGPQYFLRTLQTLSGALAVTPKTTISALSYRENALDMTVNAPSLAALSQLTQSVGKEGFAAEIQSSNPIASGVEAHLHVRDQSARAQR